MAITRPSVAYLRVLARLRARRRYAEGDVGADAPPQVDPGTVADLARYDVHLGPNFPGDQNLAEQIVALCDAQAGAPAPPAAAAAFAERDRALSPLRRRELLSLSALGRDILRSEGIRPLVQNH
jgi:hypothetical protein